MSNPKWIHSNCPIHKIPFVVHNVKPDKTTYVCPECQETSRGGSKEFWENIDKLQKIEGTKR